MPLSSDSFPQTPVTPYAQIRDELRSGDILLASGKGVISRLIQGITESPWSHVGIVLRLPDIDRVMLLESVEPDGVRIIRLSHYVQSAARDSLKAYDGGMVIARHENFAQQTNDGGLRTFMAKALDLCGHSYDKDEIAKIVARIAAWKLGVPASAMAPSEPDKEYICSEYVDECYKSIGIAPQRLNPASITPADFAADPHFALKWVIQAQS